MCAIVVLQDTLGWIRRCPENELCAGQQREERREHEGVKEGDHAKGLVEVVLED